MKKLKMFPGECKSACSKRRSEGTREGGETRFPILPFEWQQDKAFRIPCQTAGNNSSNSSSQQERVSGRLPVQCVALLPCRVGVG